MSNRKNQLVACLSIVLAACLLLGGCGSSKVAAKVGDQEITVTQLENMYNSNSPYASYYGYDLTTESGVEAFQDFILNQMISSAMQAYQARKAGLELTDEEKVQAKENAESSYQSTYQQFLDMAKSAGSSDATAYANQQFAKALSDSGLTVTKMKKQLLEDAEDSILVAKHTEQLLAETTPTAEELKASYDKQAEEQKTLFDETPSQYFTYEAMADYGYTFKPVYVPEGFFYVRQILVENEETANQIKERIDAGEDFEELLKEFNTDPGMSSEENSQGYLVGEGASYVKAFLDAALALEKEGDVSAPVQSDYGWHIIKRMEDAKAGAVPYEEIQQEFDAFTTNQLQSEAYQERLQNWINDSSLVTLYEENYRSIGKSSVVAAEKTEPAAEAEPEAAE
jgi:uncharacterized lipoprotein NlpE involved in copper resistance